MRFDPKPQKPDPELVWHKYFAWRPVKFEYGIKPNCAWLETVIRKKHWSNLLWGCWVYSYRPLEDATRFPSQYGLGRDG